MSVLALVWRRVSPEIGIGFLPQATQQSCPAVVIGPPGRDGASWGVHVHEQAVAATQWSVDHGFGRRPIVVETTTASGQSVWGEVSHPTTDRTTIEFVVPVAGQARLA